jgi:hypothetical protein
MTRLDDYVLLVKASSGLLHQRNIATLRNYLTTSPEETIINEIYRLQDIEGIRVLWEAGLNTTFQRHALERYGQLMRRQ